MRLLVALLLTACGGAPELSIVPDPPDLRRDAPDAYQAAQDLAQPAADLSSPPEVDAAQPPAGDMATCGQLGGLCCSATVCVASGLPAGSYCPQGTCAGGSHVACRMNPQPTCEPCGGSGQWCCPGATPCLLGSSCAGPSSANAGHCS